MQVICDIDNVLVDWQSTWIRKYEREFRRVPWDTRGRWDCYNSGTHFTGYGAFSAWLGEAFWFDLNAPDSLIPGGIAGIGYAVAEGHEVTLATHRPEGAPQEAARTLAERLNVPVVFATPLEKPSLDGDMWIDDSPECLWELKRQGKQGIRFVCPWNDGAPGLPMEDWSEFASTLAALNPVPVVL